MVRLPACHAGGHGFESRTLRQVLCSGRLSVRTPPFHGGKRGSIPLPSTSYTCRSLTTLAPDEKRISRPVRERTRKTRSQTVPFESDGEYLLFPISVTVAYESPKLLVAVRIRGGKPNIKYIKMYIKRINIFNIHNCIHYATVAERPNATDCKSVTPSVQI